jgi:hypothetical protein
MAAMKTNSKPRVEPRTENQLEQLNTRKKRQKARGNGNPTTEFGRSLKDLLGKPAIAGQLNEEELFAATTYQLIANRFGEQTAKDFKSAFRLNMVDKPARERFSSPERATKESLKFFVESTIMTKEEARGIRELAFSAAQLDDDSTKVWDSWGNTRAVTSFSKGQTLVQGRLEESGEAPVSIASRKKEGMSAYQESSPTPQAKRSRKKVGRQA